MVHAVPVPAIELGYGVSEEGPAPDWETVCAQHIPESSEVSFNINYIKIVTF